MTQAGWPTVPHTFLALEPREHTLERARVVLLPVPYDATTSYRAGARDGPAAILNASRQMEDYDPELRCEPSSVGIYTAPEIEPHAGGPAAMVERVSEAVAWYAGQDKLVGLLGGEHSLSAGAVHAIVGHIEDVSVLVFDAQADLREEYQGSRLSHASAVRRIGDEAPVTLIGVRSMTRDEAEFVHAHAIPVFMRTSEPITDVDAIVDGLRPNVYVSFDLDAFDPSFMAAVGTPEPGGLGWWEALDIIRAVGERRRIVGFDVVKVAPAEGPVACAYTAAKLVYKVIAYATRQTA